MFLFRITNFKKRRKLQRKSSIVFLSFYYFSSNFVNSILFWPLPAVALWKEPLFRGRPVVVSTSVVPFPFRFIDRLKTKFPSGEVKLHRCITERSKTYAPQKRNDTEIIGLKRNKIQETNKRQRAQETRISGKKLLEAQENLSEVHWLSGGRVGHCGESVNNTKGM